MTGFDGSIDVQSTVDHASAAVEYDEANETYRSKFDTQACPPSEAVIDTVAAATGCDFKDLPSLYFVIDPEALDNLFTPTSVENASQSVCVTFTYEGQQVTVDGEGVTVISESPE